MTPSGDPGSAGPIRRSWWRYRSATLLFLLLAVLSVASTSPDNASYTTAIYDAVCTIIVRNDVRVASSPDIAEFGWDSYAVAWMEEQSGEFEVMIAVSGGGGLGPAACASESPGATSRRPRVAAGPDGTIHLVWEEQAPGAEAEVFYRAWDNQNQAFLTQPLNLSVNPGRSVCPDVTVGPSGRVYVSWTDDSGGAADALLRVSSGGGAAFAPAVNLSNNALPSGTLETAVAEDPEGGVVAAWTVDSGSHGAVCLSHSGDGGATFSQLTPAIVRPSGHPVRVSLVGPYYSPYGRWFVAWNETDSVSAPSASLVWLISFSGGNLPPASATVPALVTAGGTMEGAGGLDIVDSGWGPHLVFDSLRESGRREVYLGALHYGVPTYVGVSEVSVVSSEGGYRADREAAGLAHDFRAPRGGWTSVFEEDTGIWMARVYGGYCDDMNMGCGGTPSRSRVRACRCAR